ncbi:MAG TPA: hypothetical protein PKA76_06205 [Pirellulaceae bacterium]|nr:hypothetical protein [Pirellulaceae bacterium]
MKVWFRRPTPYFPQTMSFHGGWPNASLRRNVIASICPTYYLLERYLHLDLPKLLCLRRAPKYPLLIGAFKYVYAYNRVIDLYQSSFKIACICQ